MTTYFIGGILKGANDMGIQRDQLSSDTKSYLVLVSESISKQYLVHANSEEEAKENYKDGEEGDCKTLEEFVVEVEEIA